MRIILDNYAPPDFVRKLLDNTPYLWYNRYVSGNLVILVVLRLKPNIVRTQEKQMETKEEQMTRIEKLKNAAWAADAASIAAMEAADVAWESYIDARRKSWAKGDKAI